MIFEPSNKIEDLLKIMEALRDPVSGCPWDIEQTSKTIAHYALEEAEEVVEAINNGDKHELCDELGDLLLQVVFHSQIAKEQGNFNFGDVVKAINSKMIRRHPHVFGDKVFGDKKGISSQEVKLLWQDIKAAEKAQRSANRKKAGLPDENISVISGIRSTQPALTRALKLQEKASSVGFDWDNPKLVLAKLREEINEIEDAIDNKQQSDIHEEIGDLLFVIANLARHMRGNPETILHAANAKFERRFQGVETLIAEQGKSMQNATLDEMETAWQKVKQSE
jgi:nucleoside triphosphate diphosphatase